MPADPGFDAGGALHSVMVRGLERRAQWPWCSGLWMRSCIFCLLARLGYGGCNVRYPKEPVAALMLRLTGADITRCPVCRVGGLHGVGHLRPEAVPVPVWDTS